MRQGVGGEEKERFFAGFADKIQSAIGEEIMTVVLPGDGIVRKFKALMIRIKILREIVVGMILIKITKPAVKALI